MILNSFTFIVLCPLILLLYVVVVWLCKDSRYSNLLSAGLLTLISYLFFIYEQPAGAFFLFLVTLFTYLFSLYIEKNNGKRSGIAVITCFVCIVLLPLLIFKYYNFIISLASDIARGLHLGSGFGSGASYSFVVPLGISFFTFQAVGYMWDVYRKKIPAEKNFLYYMLFVGFFPQIASGPISKASELLPQIKKHKIIDYADFAEGARLMLWGYFLKAVVADRLATFVNPVYADYSNFSGMTCFIASVFYSLQIYGDFAGYSLIAIGVGRLFGFDLINNFRRPYLSHSVTEFWKRWHISLTRWLRDYVYIPMGGNRKGKGRTYMNIMTTFLVSGLWHGANITFIVWGAVHGVAQCVERFFKFAEKPENRLMLVFRIMVTFLVVNFAWIFFRLPSVSDALAVIMRIFTCAPGASLEVNNSSLAMMAFAIGALLVSEFVGEFFPHVKTFRHSKIYVRIFSIVLVLFIILTVGVLDSSQFIYVNF